MLHFLHYSHTTLEVQRQKLESYILGDNSKGKNTHVRKDQLRKNWEK